MKNEATQAKSPMSNVIKLSNAYQVMSYQHALITARLEKKLGWSDRDMELIAARRMRSTSTASEKKAA